MLFLYQSMVRGEPGDNGCHATNRAVMEPHPGHVTVILQLQSSVGTSARERLKNIEAATRMRAENVS